jgi:hypothetical protein
VTTGGYKISTVSNKLLFQGNWGSKINKQIEIVLHGCQIVNWNFVFVFFSLDVEFIFARCELIPCGVAVVEFFGIFSKMAIPETAVPFLDDLFFSLDLFMVPLHKYIKNNMKCLLCGAQTIMKAIALFSV